jgi:hypothetical protein
MRPQLAVSLRKASMMRQLSVLVVLFTLAIAGCSSASEPTATYTAGACDYDGPSEFEVNSTVTFTFTNESDESDVGFSVLKFPEGSTPEEIFNEGIFSVVASDDAIIDFVPAPTVNGTEYDLTVTFIETGQHGINCFNLAADTESDYVTMFTVTE